jgi:hypothetical protein
VLPPIQPPAGGRAGHLSQREVSLEDLDGTSGSRAVPRTGASRWRRFRRRDILVRSTLSRRAPCGEDADQVTRTCSVARSTDPARQWGRAQREAVRCQLIRMPRRIKETIVVTTGLTRVSSGLSQRCAGPLSLPFTGCQADAHPPVMLTPRGCPADAPRCPADAPRRKRHLRRYIEGRSTRATYTSPFATADLARTMYQDDRLA